MAGSAAIRSVFEPTAAARTGLGVNAAPAVSNAAEPAAVSSRRRLMVCAEAGRTAAGAAGLMVVAGMVNPLKKRNGCLTIPAGMYSGGCKLIDL